MANATEAMNEATQSMKNAAWWSFGAVVLGTLLLGYTLKLTRAATASAQEAVDVTRRIGEAQVRAYISVQDIKTSVLDHESPVHIKFSMRNGGASPARKLTWCGSAFVSDTFIRNEVAKSKSLNPNQYVNEIAGQSEKTAEILTCHGIFPPPSIRVRTNLRTDNEANEI